jgi:hypothetical protein
MAGRDAGGVSLEGNSVTFTPTRAALSTQRITNARTLTNSGTLYVSGQINVNYPSGVAIDITLRIGLPQLENAGVNTGVASATVASGGTGYTNGDTLTVVGGTGTAATLTVTGVSTGVITSVSVASAGSYSVFPPSPVSVTGGTGSTATFNLVPVSQAANCGPTSVILTSSGQVTRSSDQANITVLTPWYNAIEGALYVKFTTGGNTLGQRAAGFDNGSLNNRMDAVAGTSSGGGPWLEVADATVVQARVPDALGVMAKNTTYSLAGAYKANDFAASINGAAVGTDTSGTVPSVTTFRIGNTLGNSSQLNGWIQKIAYYPRRLSNAELQSITA